MSRKQQPPKLTTYEDVCAKARTIAEQTAEEWVQSILTYPDVLMHGSMFQVQVLDAVHEVFDVLWTFEEECNPDMLEDDRPGNREQARSEAGFLVGLHVGQRLRAGAVR